MADSTASPTDALKRNQHFLMRRLHSLSGIVPVGVFVIFHLFTNMQLAFGTFQHEVDFIHNMPALLFLEIFGLWLPIGFHAALGLVYTFSGKPNSMAYQYTDNWRYTLQRVSGIVALIFIFLHIATLRWRWNLLGWYTPFFAEGVTPDGEVIGLATASTAMALQASVLVALLYFAGVLSVIYHWSNGLWTAAISWGLTIQPKAQKRWGFVCAGLFVALFVFSALAFQGALAYEPTDKEKSAMAFMEKHHKDKELKHKIHEADRGDIIDVSHIGQGDPQQTAVDRDDAAPGERS